MLPESLLKEAQEELLDWQGLGVSILELGHRTPEFIELLDQLEQSLRAILTIPKHYHVLFLGGPARMQFAAIPMNFLSPQEQAGYLVTGIWSKMALQEAQILKKAYCVASGEATHFRSIPECKTWDIQKKSKYIYYTPNETVNGVRFPDIPKITDLPLVADMTSCLLSEPIDIQQYGLIFAGAQKNIANTGLTLVIVREDLLEEVPNPPIPTMLHYPTQVKNRSLYATAPVFNCYLAKKMLDWVKAQGGIEALFRQNCLKAAKLYQYLDASDFYLTQVAKEARSIMNLCFSIKNPLLEEQFIALAKEQGLYALKGHRLVGGLRASLYNAMPMSGVDALIDFMVQFAKEYGE